ncbi:helix-turn-helix transcriptional regulator [Paenibacillus xylanexedens]|uniref:helix-turn-helix transcriptional regulator n=1 Tax=Paenibacillus xylanexedens TaxID=528191 RepID=UPI0011A9DD23|nr:helix-turn-helix transcriptional regulator [Paenibacillus xylanexedens]
MSQVNMASMTVLQYLALVHQLSYTELCKTIGMTPQQFNDWVKKRRPVPQDRLQQVAQFFQIDSSVLVYETNYLRDLTPENKVQVQMIYIKQQLEQEGDVTEQEALRQKLIQLQEEKRKQTLITQFAAAVNQADEQLLQEYEQLVNRLSTSANRDARLVREEDKE